MRLTMLRRRRCGCVLLGGSARAAQAPAARRRSRRRSSALAPANLAKPRPKPPFDLTGIWLHANGPDNPFRFSPPPGFKLTPAGAGALRRGAEGAGRGQGLPRRHRPVLAGRAAGDHDARLADRDDAAADRDLHGQRVHEQPARRLSRRPAAHRSRRRRAAASTASRSAAGKATRWWSTRSTSSATTTGSTPGIPASDALHIVERIRMINDGKTLEIEYAHDRSEELGRRVEVDQAVEPRGRPRHRRGVVLCPISTITCRARARRTTSDDGTDTLLARSRCARAVLLAGGAAVRPITRPPASIARRAETVTGVGEGVPLGQPARVDRPRRAQRQGRAWTPGRSR